MKGLELKEKGLDISEMNNKEWLVWVRTEMKMLHLMNKSMGYQSHVDADDARNVSNACNRHPQNPQAAYGAIFRGKEWECVGRTISKHPDNHGREIKLWKYVG